MYIDALNEKFFCDYKEFILSHNFDLAKKVWKINSNKISSRKNSLSSSEGAYNFGIFSLNLINGNLTKDFTEEDKISFYSNIICDGKPDYSFDAIYIPDEGNIQIYDFKSGNQGLDFNDIETFKTFFIKHIEEQQRINSDNPILISLLDKLDQKILSDKEVKLDIYIIREKNIDEYSEVEKQLNELRWKTKRVKIGEINIIDGNKINDILRNNLLELSNYNTSFYDLNAEKIVELDDGSNIVVTSLYELLSFYLMTKKNNYDVFKLNVRNEVSNNVIKGNMIETIEKAPEKFFRFHNGINVTYAQIKMNKNNLQFQFPQIINGCQTVSVLQKEFLKYLKIYLNINSGNQYNTDISLEEVIKNIEKLKIAKILIKTHKANLLDGEIDKISEYSNNQNHIDKENLRSNDLIQIIIEQLINNLGYKYVRKEGASKEGNYIEIGTLFQLIHTCIFELPNWSKNNKKQIFTFDDSKYSYINILNNTSLDDIKKITSIYFKYIDFKNKKSIMGDRISDYYDHYMILSLFFILNNGGKAELDNSKDFDLIYKIINEIKKREALPTRDLLQKKGQFVWMQLKHKVCQQYNLRIVFTIGNEKYDVTELEIYKLDRSIEKERNKKSKLGNITSVIKKVVNNNDGISEDALFLILSNFYSDFWGDEIKKDKFKNDVERSISGNFRRKNNGIYKQ